MALPVIGFVLAASAVLLTIALLLRRRAKANGLLAGEVVYFDGRANDETLNSHVYGLTGKPDYILKASEELVPVERKSRMVSAAGASKGEILQLAAYCLLVEEHFGKPVRRGQLAYKEPVAGNRF